MRVTVYGLLPVTLGLSAANVVLADEKLNEIQRYKLAKTGRNEYQIFGENVVLTIDMVRDYLAV